LNFDVELLFPSTSNNDHGLFDFDSFDAGDWNAASEFVDDLFSVPNPGSQSDMTIPRFTELAADDPLETLDASSTESAIDPTPVVVAPVAENAKRTRYSQGRFQRLIKLGLVARQLPLSKVATCTVALGSRDAFNVGNGDRRYTSVRLLSKEQSVFTKRWMTRAHCAKNADSSAGEKRKSSAQRLRSRHRMETSIVRACNTCSPFHTFQPII